MGREAILPLPLLDLGQSPAQLFFPGRSEQGVAAEETGIPVVEVPDNEKAPTEGARIGHQVSGRGTVEILLMLEVLAEQPLGHIQLLGGGADVGAVARIHKGVVKLRLGFQAQQLLPQRLVFPPLLDQCVGNGCKNFEMDCG